MTHLMTAAFGRPQHANVKPGATSSSRTRTRTTPSPSQQQVSVTRETLSLPLLLVALFAVSAASSRTVPGTNGDDPLIVAFLFGGTDAEGRYPYLASFRKPDTNAHFCAGALISPSVVLTAAHCLDPRLGGHPRPIVHLGRRCTTCDDEAGFVELRVAHDHIHPSWTGDLTRGADIAVVVLEEAAPEGHPMLSLGPQPDGGEEALSGASGAALWVAGWGTVDNDFSLPGTLQHAELPLVLASTCAARYRAERFGNAIRPSMMICAGGEGAETCMGDSGGPLVLQEGGSDDGWISDVAVGVVSFGNDVCGDPSSLPGVFTSVSAFRDFLMPFVEPLPPHCGPELPGYVLHPGMDSGGNDIAFSDARSVEAFARICSEDPACRGFNSNGWIKHTIAEEAAWYKWTEDPCLGLYVKVCPQVPSGYEFHPRVDSGGNDIKWSQAGSLEGFARICSEDSTCKGFNSNGWIKHTIVEEAAWYQWTEDPCQGLYVKGG